MIIPDNRIAPWSPPFPWTRRPAPQPQPDYAPEPDLDEEE